VDQLTVDFAVLENFADSISEHIDATTEKVDEVDKVVTDLGTTWTGDAHDASTGFATS
jgi:uncharacterized protein YukE